MLTVLLIAAHVAVGYIGYVLGGGIAKLRAARSMPRLSIRDAHRRDASLTARLATPSPVLARCDQAGDIAAGLERRRELPLPAPDETPTTRGGAA
jgi:hypothetical protein